MDPVSTQSVHAYGKKNVQTNIIYTTSAEEENPHISVLGSSDCIS